MKTPSQLFTDKVRLLYKEFHHYTPNWSSIYTYIFERLERLDIEPDPKNPTYKPYNHFDSIKVQGYHINETPNDTFIIEYTRKNKNSWDFKLLNTKQI